MWNLKTLGTDNLIDKAEQRCRHREQAYGHQRGEEGVDELEIGVDICTLLTLYIK